LVESTGANVAKPDANPLASDIVKFVPVPPGYVMPPPIASLAASPASKANSKLDAASISALSTVARNTLHGIKEVGHDTSITVLPSVT
jgi:hypothetical protein